MMGTMSEEKAYNSPLFQGKIALITDHPFVNVDDFHSPDRLVAKYGAGKIIHANWPEEFIVERDTMIDTVTALAADSDVRALIINQAVEGSNIAVDKLRESRDDIFVVYCNTNEKRSEAVLRADLILSLDEIGMGSAMVKQAKKQGAKVFVHYSFPRHMAQLILSSRRDVIKQECINGGIVFVDATAPDPAAEASLSGIQQFFHEDVPKLVARYGEDTAFYSTNCAQQISLIKAVVDNHAIYPQPCCPSPFNGFPEALGIRTDGNYADVLYVINEACRIAAEKNMTDRLSTWPMSSSMMFTNAGAEYAIRWINNEVPKKGIDREVLEQCMNDYVEEVIGEASVVYMTPYSERGETYYHYIQVLMSYLDF